MPKIYAGIGSRETPAHILQEMTNGASNLANYGWLLRSGHADGADAAFEAGAGRHSEIHLPWHSYNKDKPRYVGASYLVPQITQDLLDVAARNHPAWDRLSDPVRKLMCRNATIILGADLNTPVDMVICWTPGARLQGGTAHGIRIAREFHIPVYNLASSADVEALNKIVF